MPLDTKQRYLPLEKLSYTLVISSWKLKHYFEAYSITSTISFLLKVILHKFDLFGCIPKWSVELGIFNIHFQSMIAVKGKILANFIAEFIGDSLTDQHMAEYLIDHK